MPEGYVEPTPGASPTTKTGDFNRDGVVNGSDVKLLFSNWLVGGICGLTNCDLTGDTKVNLLDFGWTVKNWGI